MTITMVGPDVSDLDPIVETLRQWQSEPVSGALHPGDLGWFWRFGSSTIATSLRIWRRGADTVAIGLLDGKDLLRLGIAPGARQDRELAAQVAIDLTRPERGVLGDREVATEVPSGALIADTLAGHGWRIGDAWSPLRRNLSEPVEPCGARIEFTTPPLADSRVAVQRAAFEGSTFTVDRWTAMAAGPAYADARCLMLLDDHGEPVAATTVWSAGPGRTGLIEPLGVHADHRGRGYGRAVTLAAAATLQSLGSSWAVVATPSANTAAVATYVSAGFERLPEIHDRIR